MPTRCPFINLFIQHIFIIPLLCARHFSRCLEKHSKQNTIIPALLDLQPSGECQVFNKPIGKKKNMSDYNYCCRENTAGGIGATSNRSTARKGLPEVSGSWNSRGDSLFPSPERAACSACADG